MTKQIAVFGATGQQGGAVARALLGEANKWKVVALTRDVNSEKAKHLRSLGAEIRSCDVSKPEDVEAAIKGSYGVFGLTDFWATHSREVEVQQGKNIIDAAKKIGVEHLVLSTLENSLTISEGKRDVIHFVSKAIIEEYLIKSGVPHTVVQPACYYENFKSMVNPNKDGQLELTLAIPTDTKFALYSVEDTGLFVSTVFNDKARYLGKKFGLVGDYISGDDVAATLSKQFGKPVKANAVPEKVYASFPFPAAEEVANMFNWFHEFGYFGEKKTGRDIWEGKSLAPKVRTFAQWAQNWKL